MTDMQYILHAVCIFLFFMNLGFTLASVRSIWKSSFAGGLKQSMVTAMFSSAGLSALFIYLQLDWVLSGHNESVGEAVSWAWLVFDYLLAIFLIACANTMHALSFWACSDCHRRWHESRGE